MKYQKFILLYLFFSNKLPIIVIKSPFFAKYKLIFISVTLIFIILQNKLLKHG